MTSTRVSWKVGNLFGARHMKARISGRRMRVGLEAMRVERQSSGLYFALLVKHAAVLDVHRDQADLSRRLVELLKSEDPLVLQIAASDIGQYIKYATVPDKAKNTVADLGGKTRMIELMGHQNPEVRYRALMSVQRLMSLHA